MNSYKLSKKSLVLMATVLISSLINATSVSQAANLDCNNPAVYPPNIATCLDKIPELLDPKLKPAWNFTLIPNGANSDRVIVTIDGITKTVKYQTFADQSSGEILLKFAIEGVAKFQLLGRYINNQVVGSPSENLVLTISDFVPDSALSVWLLSKPKFLGNINTDYKGNHFSTIKIPENFPIGEHFLQVAGKLANKSHINISMPFLVTDKPKILSKSKVYFQLNSSYMSNRQKNLITNMIQKISRTSGTNELITWQLAGYVQGSKETRSLATDRANAVAEVLKSGGITDQLYVLGKGNATEKGNLARYVQITVTNRKFK